MRRFSWTLALGAILFCLAPDCLAPDTVEAQDARAQARQHYATGQQLFDSGQFAAAEEQFRAAYTLVPNPVVLRAIASAQERQGNYAGALASLEQYVRENPAASDRAEVDAKIVQFRAQVGGTTGDPMGTGDPNAVAPTYGTEQGPPEPSIGVWIAAGVAVAGLILGTVMGFLALSEQSNFDNAPSHEIADRGETFALVADISFGVAGAAAITAIVLYIIDATAAPAEQPTAFQLTPWANHQGGGLNAQLRF